MFFPPIDIQQALIQHTQSVSVPVHHSNDRSSAVIRFETDIYLHRKCNKIPGTYAIYSCVWRLWVIFLEHGGGALDIFTSPVCTYNQAWTFSLSASHYFYFLSKRSGRRMPPAERSALYNSRKRRLRVFSSIEMVSASCVYKNIGRACSTLPFLFLVLVLCCLPGIYLFPLVCVELHVSRGLLVPRTL